MGFGVGLIAAWTLLIVPMRIVEVGFRPVDDARRHVGKVLSDRSWQEILVLRPEVEVDPHPGWHELLGLARRAGIDGPNELLIFSSLSLAVLFLMLPLLLRPGRPEAWLLALFTTAIGGADLFHRILSGRPLVFAMCVLLAVAVGWPRLQAERMPRGALLGFTALFALTTWIHGNWILWVLPLAAFVLAGEIRAASRLGLALGAGIAIGAAMTGAPRAFLVQTFKHPFWSLSADLPQWLLAREFQPFDGEAWMVGVVLALLACRWARRRAVSDVLRDPVFLLAVAGWVLGYQTLRFWRDWGEPACLVWMTREFDQILAPVASSNRRRVLLVAVVGVALVLAATNDRERRWSSSERAPLLSLDNPAHRPWLPAPGGILYSNQMRTFYNTFWRNPRAPWRYMVGFEPALMPPSDLAIFRRIQLESSSDAAFAPWVEKMRPQDRLVIVRDLEDPPRLTRLDWYSPYRGMWIGRLRVADSAAAAHGEQPADTGTPAAARADGEEPDERR